MSTFGVTLAALLFMAEQETIVISTGPHYVSPKYHQIDYETACGSTVFRIRLRQGPGRSGRVDLLLIDGRPVRNAAQTLQNRAARRLITSVEILDCGKDPRRPVILGMMNLEPMESQRLGMPSSLTFRLAWERRRGWGLTLQ